MMKQARSNTEQDILPLATADALRKLIKISEQLLSLSEKETQVLVRNDIVTFAILQQEKELLSRHYAKASGEFRERLEEFRGADRGLIERLETLQTKLGEKARSNNTIVERMYKRSTENTKKSLLTVQELAQMRPVVIEDAIQQEGA